MIKKNTIINLNLFFSEGLLCDPRIYISLMDGCEDRIVE